MTYCKTFEEYQKRDHNVCRVSFNAGYEAAKEEMKYDVHTCHAECPRLMCVQRREIEELQRKLEIIKQALQQYSLEYHNGFTAREALKEIEK